MSKKKLAFYDAFKQKNNENTEEVVDPSTTTNIAGHTSFTPGEELQLRPEPKHMPTARHNVNLNPTEIRAKGSSIPPGIAEKWQVPNVNKEYIKNDSDHLPKSNTKNPDVPLEESKPSGMHTEIASANVPNVKPVSLQSETLPYLENNDLETESFPKPTHSNNTSFNKLDDIKGQIILSPANGLSLIALFMVSICISFYFGMLFKGNNNPNIGDSSDLRLNNDDVNKARSEFATNRNTTDKPVSSGNITKKKASGISLKKDKEKPKTVDNNDYLYTIRAITVPSGSRAKSFKEILEKEGFKYIISKKTRRGYLISLGRYKTKKEANKVLKRLVKKVIRHSRPFSSAYIVNK